MIYNLKIQFRIFMDLEKSGFISYTKIQNFDEKIFRFLLDFYRFFEYTVKVNKTLTLCQETNLSKRATKKDLVDQTTLLSELQTEL